MAFAAVALGVGAAAFGGSWAAHVVSYDPGAAAGGPYTTAAAALGLPDDVTGEGAWPSVLSPFSPAYMGDEIVQIGEGGHLTLQLASYAVAGAGCEIGVVTNVALTDAAWPGGVNTDPAGAFGADSAVVEVSDGGTTWVALGEVLFDMPANYFTDAATPYDTTPASAIADFGKPFEPAGGLAAFDGVDWPGTLAVLDGSGGGTWLDVSPAGLDQVGYVRFSVPDDGDDQTQLTFEIDAVLIATDAVGAAVPEPAAIALLAGGSVALLRRWRRRP